MVDDDTDLEADLGAEWTSTIFLPRPVNLLSIKACPISEVKSQINSDNMIVKVWLTQRKCKQWYFQDSLIISESLCLSNYWFVLLDFAFTPIDRSVIVLDWQSSKLYVRGEKWFNLSTFSNSVPLPCPKSAITGHPMDSSRRLRPPGRDHNWLNSCLLCRQWHWKWRWQYFEFDVSNM